MIHAGAQVVGWAAGLGRALGVTDILVQGVFTYGRMLRLAPSYLVFMSCM